jgi:hypothetical protein
MPTETITVPQSFVAGTKVPQTFPELLALYKTKEADANVDLNGVTDPMTRPGMEIRKNGAIQALPGLRAELVRLVEQNSGAIFLSGTKEGIETFIGIAQDQTEGNIVVVSAKEMYVELAKYIDRGIRRDRRFSMDTINSYVDGILRILDRIQVDGIPSPNLVPNLNKVFETLDDVTVLARESLQGMQAPNGVTIGDGLNAIYLQLRAAEEAIKEGVATPFLPVIVIDATPEETKGSLFETLFFGRNVVFKATKDETDGNSVVHMFQNLKKQRTTRGTRANKQG